MKSRIKLGTMLLASFAAVACIALVIGTVGYYGAVKNQQAMHETGSVRLASVDSLLLTKAHLERIRGVVEALTKPNLTADLRKQEFDEFAILRQRYGATLKAYTELPKTAAEAEKLPKFVALLDAWRAENNKALEMARQFDGIGIVDPEALALRLEEFTRDHYVVVQKVLQGLRSQDGSFAGGEDHTACRAGKWLASFQTPSQTLAAETLAIRGAHERFHTAVRVIKGLVRENKSDEASVHYEQTMLPAMQEVFSHFEAMRKAVDTALDLSKTMEEQVHGPAAASQESTLVALDELVQANRDSAAGTVQASTKQSIVLKKFSLGAMIVGTLAAVTLGFFVTRSITKPIQRIATLLSAGADQATTAATQVAGASQTLAAGASEQAAAVEETSSSLEELSSMTKRNTDSATRATELARQARQAAEKGATDMQAMNSAMQAIKASSNEVAKIIKTIDEIAFQTNILALNAAVEAARAGEAGMGFAVVAEEVRSLAQRSAQAAKDTAAKIEGAIGNTAEGVDISSTVSQALGEIVTKAREVDTLVAEVANASREQMQGIGQINSAVGQMDKVVQTNAAAAEESAASAEELSDQASAVRSSVAELLTLVGATAREANVGPAASGRKTALLIPTGASAAGAVTLRAAPPRTPATLKSSAGGSRSPAASNTSSRTNGANGHDDFFADT